MTSEIMLKLSNNTLRDSYNQSCTTQHGASNHYHTTGRSDYLAAAHTHDLRKIDSTRRQEDWTTIEILASALLTVWSWLAACYCIWLLTTSLAPLLLLRFRLFTFGHSDHSERDGWIWGLRGTGTCALSFSSGATQAGVLDDGAQVRIFD